MLSLLCSIELLVGDMGACRVLGSFAANKVATNLHITAQGHGYRECSIKHIVDPSSCTLIQ
jgi:hypothetical protein